MSFDFAKFNLLFWIHDKRKVYASISKFVTNTMHVDGRVSTGARVPAGTVMTKLKG